MDRFGVHVLAVVSFGRFAAIILIAILAVPAPAAIPEPARPLTGMLVEADLPSDAGKRTPGRGERPAYPTEQPPVPAHDALRPPDLLWSPAPGTLVRVMPPKVRYKLTF